MKQLVFKINNIECKISDEQSSHILSFFDERSVGEFSSTILSILLSNIIKQDKKTENELSSLENFFVFPSIIEDISCATLHILAMFEMQINNATFDRSFKFKGYTLQEWYEDIKTTRDIFSDYLKRLLKLNLSSYVVLSVEPFTSKPTYSLEIFSCFIKEQDYNTFINDFIKVLDGRNFENIEDYLNSLNRKRDCLQDSDANIFRIIEELKANKCPAEICKYISLMTKAKYAFSSYAYGDVFDSKNKKLRESARAYFKLLKRDTLINLINAYIPYIELAEKINNINR